ncbi:MAG: TonB-dependent receptor [Bacteroidota bacterium]
MLQNVPLLYAQTAHLPRLLLVFLLIYLTQATSFAQATEVTVSGQLTEAETGETIIGATIAVPSIGAGTTTNAYGFYSLSLPRSEEAVTIVFSYVGSSTQERDITPTQDLVINIELGTGVELEEVVVKANSFEEQLNSTQMSVEQITTREAKLLPAFLGEVDVLKTIQLKPGIPSGSEGSTGLFVRGGASDQNLIVLDEAVVYNPNHLFGFFSTFNADAVKDLRLYKGGFPAQYGGRLSSVIDVKLREGNKKKYSAAGGIGLISSRLTVEGPIQKNKSSFIVSGRRTYVDIFTEAINRGNRRAVENGERESFTQIPGYFFYDLNTKVNFQLGEKDRIYLSGYFGRDAFNFEDDFFDFRFDWGNATGTARWNHIFSSKLFSNTTFTFSDYQYNITNEVTGFSFDLGSNIRDANLKTDFYYNMNNRHEIRFGVGATYHQFEVGRLKAGSDDGSVSFSGGSNFDGTEFGIYASDDFKVNNRLTMNYGLRLSGFANDGKTYFGVEPRFAANYKVSERFSFKGSYARMMQYVHLVSNAGIALPTDIWYPSTSNVKPQISDQVAIGGSFLIGRDLFITNEYYYKNLQNQIDFIDGAQLFANEQLEEEFAFGRGYAYGMELGIEKKEGALTGWIGYTLAWVRRGAFRGVKRDIMDGRFFRPNYDRRHDISIVLLYEISDKWTATATYVYGSGDLAWLPGGRFTFQDIYGGSTESVVPIFGDRNNYRLPSFQRMDVGIVRKFQPKWGESDLTISVFNALDRRNTFFIFLEPEFAEGMDDEGNLINFPERIAAKQVSLFPILPSITYNFKF